MSTEHGTVSKPASHTIKINKFKSFSSLFIKCSASALNHNEFLPESMFLFHESEQRISQTTTNGKQMLNLNQN